MSGMRMAMICSEAELVRLAIKLVYKAYNAVTTEVEKA